MGMRLLNDRDRLLTILDADRAIAAETQILHEEIAYELFVVHDKNGFAGIGGGTGRLTIDRFLFPDWLLNDAIDAFDQYIKRESLPHKVSHAQGTCLVLLDFGRTAAQYNHRRVWIHGANFF